MGRDQKFEVQYLLSLMVVVMGIVSIKSPSRVVSEIVGLSFLFCSASHLLLITTVYSFSETSDLNFPVLERISGFSRWALRFVTLFFIYLIFHSLLYSSYRRPPEIISIEAAKRYQTLITFGAPVIPVAVIAGIFGKRILPSLRISKDISVTVVPEEVKIQPSYDGSREVLVEIENESEREYTFDIKIDVPDKVTGKFEREEFTNTLDKEVTLDAKSRISYNLRMRHDERENRRERLSVTISHDSGEFSKDINCFLRT